MSKRAARRQGVLGVVGCGTGPLLWVHAHAPPLQHHLRGGYKKRNLYAFQGGQRHHGRFGASDDEKGVGGAKESNHQRASPGDVALGHALR